MVGSGSSEQKGSALALRTVRERAPRRVASGASSHAPLVEGPSKNREQRASRTLWSRDCVTIPFRPKGRPHGEDAEPYLAAERTISIDRRGENPCTISNPTVSLR